MMFDELFERTKILSEKFDFLGTCRDIVDPEDVEEVSALAGTVDAGKEITKDVFLVLSDVWDVHLKMLEVNPENYEYFYNEDKRISWFRDIDEDVEYFYG